MTDTWLNVRRMESRGEWREAGIERRCLWEELGKVSFRSPSPFKKETGDLGEVGCGHEMR